jgi:CheY-like chemotaxis protein
MILTDPRPSQPLSILVGIPDANERAKITALLRGEGHRVVEAADPREMGERLDQSGHAGFDAIVCAGLLSEADDPALSARLSNPAVAPALILLSTGGLLATASRAQRLHASAVLSDAPSLHRLRELLSEAADRKPSLNAPGLA